MAPWEKYQGQRQQAGPWVKYAQSPEMQAGLAELSALTQNPQIAAPQYDGGAFRAATEGSQAGLMFGFDDEITAGMLAPVDAAIDWFQGEGFDLGRAYREKQQTLDEQKAARRSEHPVASIAGEVAGGLAGGGTAAKAGASLVGRNVPLLSQAAPRATQVGLAGAEGAAYGGLYGAGEARPGERLEGAKTGALVGGLTGAGIQAAGNALATAASRRAANAAAPQSDDLANTAQALYRASENEGVRFKAPAVQRLGANMKAAAGRINDRLRPKTAGFVDDIDAMFNGEMSLEAFDEFRKSLNKELRRASPDDARTLTAMKRMADAFADSVNPSQMTGDVRKAMGYLKDARQNWQRAAKTETIEKILDRADIDGSGKYTQSGFANAIRREMNNLYKAIQKGKEAGWTKEEIALIRQMAKGGSNSTVVNLFAKFAPRGVVSFMGGQMAGSMVPGAGNVIVPLAGEVAARAADRGALSAAQALRSGAATGMAPLLAPQITRKTAPFIGGGVAGTSELLRQIQTEPIRR